MDSFFFKFSLNLIILEFLKFLVIYINRKGFFKNLNFIIFERSYSNNYRIFKILKIFSNLYKKKRIGKNLIVYIYIYNY